MAVIIPIGKYSLPIKLEGIVDQNGNAFDKNYFLFTPTRFLYLIRVDGEKKGFKTLEMLQDYVYNSEHKEYSFRGIIFYCGFVVEEKFECEERLNLNNEVKYILPTNINCSETNKGAKYSFTSRIRNWVEKQYLNDSAPIWCNVEDFEVMKDGIELQLISNPEALIELERLNNLPEEPEKPTLFEKLRKLLGIYGNN